MKKGNKKVNNRFQTKTIIAIVAALIALISAVSVIGNRFFDNSVVEINTAHIEELADHDVALINSKIHTRFKTLETIADDIAYWQRKDGTPIIDLLHTDASFVHDADKVSYISKDGTVLSSNNVIENRPDIVDVCLKHNDNFVQRFDNTKEIFADLNREYLMYCIPVDPIEFDGHVYEYLSCFIRPSDLESELKADIYDGEGFTSVIDSDGYYIANINKSHSFLSRDNFFEEFESIEGKTPEEFLKFLSSSSSSYTTRMGIKSDKGENEEAYLVFTPMEDSDWFFVSTVPSSVFDVQSRDLFRIAGFLLAFVGVALAAVVFFVVRQQRQTAELKSKEETDALNRELQDRLGVVQSLSNDLEGVEIVTLKDNKFNDTGRIYRGSRMLEELVPDINSEDKTFSEKLKLIRDHAVVEEDREDFHTKTRRETILRELKDKITYYVNFRAKDINDELHYMQMRFSQIKDEENIIGFVCSVQNVDAQTAEQIKHREELEEALGMAESASRAKTTFLNNMSHDIRTPMNAIIGFTGLAASHIDNKEQVQDYLAKIGQSSNHLLSLINDVLDMSRIESGKMTLSENPENLAEIIHNLRDMIVADINAKELELYVDSLDVNDEHIICDKLRLNQVLLNVVSNAIKYTQTGGTISIRVAEKGVNNLGYAKYEFRVKDNGMGMSKEFLKTIFDPFTRVKSSTVSGIQGTGLGMAITKNIVDMMGGTIDIESEEGKGTEVIVSFEFKLQTEKNDPVAIPEMAGLKGLVVDDDTNACRSISKMLIDVGMRSEWCTSGKEAIIRVEDAASLNDLYRVYIIDWAMPDMNGIETTRRIRKVIGDDAPIIILTAYDYSDIEEEAKEAGVTSFCSKPLFPSDLRRVLASCVGRSSDSKKEEGEEYNFEGKKILLVEDNEMNREIAAEILEEEGFIIEAVEDGSIAVERVKENGDNYDIVLMDIQMPIMNGYDATRAIRQFNKDIPIVAMTANAFEEDKRLAIEAGMNEHIPKPIDVKVLKETISRFVK